MISPLLSEYIGVAGLFALTGVLTLLSMLVVKFLVPDPVRSKLHEDAEVQPARWRGVKKQRAAAAEFRYFSRCNAA